VVLLHAHLQNIIAPEKGFRHHAREALRENNLPELDLGEGDSWGILKVVQTPRQPPTVSPESSHDQALESQLAMIPPDLPTTPVTTPVTAPKPDTSVRPKVQKPVQPPQDPPREDPPTSPDPLPPSPTCTKTQRCHKGDGGWDRLMNGTVVDPNFYGIRLFAENPKKYVYSGKEEIGHEIRKNRIKWLMTKAEHYNMVIAQNLHTHLMEGRININNTMIEQYKNIRKIPNGHLIENTTQKHK